VLNSMPIQCRKTKSSGSFFQKKMLFV